MALEQAGKKCLWNMLIFAFHLSGLKLFFHSTTEALHLLSSIKEKNYHDNFWMYGENTRKRDPFVIGQVFRMWHVQNNNTLSTPRRIWFFFFIFTKSLTFVLGFNPYGNFSECAKHIHLGNLVNSFEVDGGQKGINIVSITKRQLFVLSKFLLSRRRHK